MYVICDAQNNLWGPFVGPKEAGEWAVLKWPDAPAYDEREPPHKRGWSIVVVRKPDH